MKVYFLRHQADNVSYDFPFAEPPTEAQLQPLLRRCTQRHGVAHSKTPDQPHWIKIVEVEVLGPNDIPEVPEVVLSPVIPKGTGKAETAELSVTGTGHVATPGGVE